MAVLVSRFSRKKKRSCSEQPVVLPGENSRNDFGTLLFYHNRTPLTVSNVCERLQGDEQGIGTEGKAWKAVDANLGYEIQYEWAESRPVHRNCR